MEFEVKLPSLGDDDDAVQGGMVALWLAKVGDSLAAEDDLIEITTDKAAFVVPTPKAGKILRINVNEGDDVRVGDVLCVLEIE